LIGIVGAVKFYDYSTNSSPYFYIVAAGVLIGGVSGGIAIDLAERFHFSDIKEPEERASKFRLFSKVSG